MTDAQCMSGETRFTDMVHYTFAQQIERELADANADYMALARRLDGHDVNECLLNLNRLKGEFAEARRLLAEIVTQYDAAPDGPLGKGFTNGPFLRARAFLSLHNDQVEVRRTPTNET
jgi:uncharacterized protein YfdQ (DUF2303 family)